MSDDPKVPVKADVKVDISSKDLAPVAQSLIDRVSSAIGKFYEPIHALRSAKAQVDAVKALGELDAENLSPIQQRAIFRMLGEGVRQQENIELILPQ